MIGKTRKQAAEELERIYNWYEPRKVTFATIYRRIWRDSRTGNWRLVGHAHDYTTEG